MNARYLNAVARALRLHVRGAVDGRAANILDDCVSVLAALANAAEPAASGHEGLPDDAVARWLAAGPPESAATYRDTVPALEAAIAALEAGEGPASPTIRQTLRQERSLGAAAIARMNETMALPPADVADPRLGIDVARLAAYLGDRTGALVTVSDFRQVIGGRSRQTALFTQEGAAGLPRDLVVQRLTPGLVVGEAFGGTAVEHRVLKTLHAAGMQVPDPLFMETDPALLGAPFMIFERAPGETVQSDYWALTSSADIAPELARQMAILHAQPPGELAEILPKARENYDRQGWLDEIAIIETRLMGDAHGPSLVVPAALAWLRANVDCVEDRRTIVHNDMVFHNIMAEDGRITAVLDWEQAAIGHPAEDLGYCYPVIAGLGAWDAFMAAYVAAGGQAITQQQVDFFALRACLRLQVLVLQGRAAFESGGTDEIVIAGAGAFFSQRLLQRLADVLDAVLDRESAG